MLRRCKWDVHGFGYLAAVMPMKSVQRVAARLDGLLSFNPRLSSLFSRRQLDDSTAAEGCCESHILHGVLLLINE
jgi:hypothetical protein